MHGFDAVARQVADACATFIEARLRDGAPLGATASPAELRERLGTTITPTGLGPVEAFARFRDVVVPATIGLDSPRFLAFIPAAPTAVSVLFDAVVSACTFSGESWLEASGAVHAENEVLRFLADAAGLPDGAGGCFVSGGSAGNLSALAVARNAGPRRDAPGQVVVADSAHSSVANALALLGLEPVVVATDEQGCLRGAAVACVDAPRVRAVVASAGSTNAGVVDALDEIAAVCAERGWWMHVDGAYGGAALLVPGARPLFAGIEAADSLIVDPHKWLFGPLLADGVAFVTPTRWKGETVGRLVFLHPSTDLEVVDEILHRMR